MTGKSISFWVPSEPGRVEAWQSQGEQKIPRECLQKAFRVSKEGRVRTVNLLIQRALFTTGRE
jgi:hypothetical protein